MAWPHASWTAADMAVRWSRPRGVAHLTRWRRFGEDEDVEGLTVVRWSSWFGEWSCGLGERLERGRRPVLWSPPARGGGSRGKGEHEWRGLRWRPQLHARAHACDVVAMAGRECHAAIELCPSATTRRRR
jgi:hypothetical protein